MPKKAKLAAAEASLEETMTLLNNKRSQLALLEARLAQLKEDYAEVRMHLLFCVGCAILSLLFTLA